MAFLDTAGLERLWIHICAKFDGLIGKSGTGTGSEIFNSYDSNSAEGDYSHAEGKGTTASGDYSHAEGQSTTASQSWAHAEGFHATASGQSSHAEGTYTVAGSSASHAEGYYTIASSANQHAQGMYNIEDKSGQYCHIVGNGESTARSNAHTLDWDGNAWFKGDVYVGGTSQSDAIKLPRITTGTDNPPSRGTAGSIYIQYTA